MSNGDKGILGFILLIIGYIIILLNFWIGIVFLLLFLAFAFTDYKENIKNDNSNSSDILFYIKWGIIIFIFTFPFLHFFLEF